MSICDDDSTSINKRKKIEGKKKVNINQANFKYANKNVKKNNILTIK